MNITAGLSCIGGFGTPFRRSTSPEMIAISFDENSSGCVEMYLMSSYLVMTQN